MKVSRAAVTGGGRGIGRACAERLLQADCKVAFCDVIVEDGEETEAALREKYGEEKAFFFACDVTDLEALEDFFKRSKEILGGLDLIINNAGILDFPRNNNCSKIVDVNLKAALKGMEAGLRLMGRDCGGGGGVVLSLGSTASYDPTSIFPAYDATKAAVLQATRSYATELWAAKGVKFICVTPGPTYSLIFDMASQSMTSEELNFLSKYVSVYKMQTPEEVAAAVMQVIQKGINGSLWFIDGGEVQPLSTAESYIKSKM